MTASHRTRLHRTLLPVLLLALLVSRPALAAAPSVSGVEPDTVSNAVASTLIVTGTDFDANAVVVLEGFGTLVTVSVSPDGKVITAELPAGIPAGTYKVEVVNSDGKRSKDSANLSVIGPTATPAPTAFVRPLLVVQSYGASSPAIVPGSDLDFEMTLQNAGQDTGNNVVATFAVGDFVPRATGGVRAIGALGAGQTARFWQPLSASRELAGKTVATLEVTVTYTDTAGTAYTDKFTLTFPVARPEVGTAAPTKTPTPKPAAVRPQLLITAYRADLETLQPGTLFTLSFDVQNAGSANAKRVSSILGGGTITGGSGPGGTPDGSNGNVGGGVSGSGGDFTNFAPVNASNVQFLGDLAVGEAFAVEQPLIVNATKAGAYPVKFSFVYTDERGNSYTDDQVVTLLVYQPPLLEISFYQPIGPLFAGQPNLLPLQVVNLGRNSTVLGNMKVTAPETGAQFSNNTILIGALDTGGYFTLDAMVIPDQPGPLELSVTVEYTDDFNQPRQIVKTLSVDVLEAPPFEPPPGEGGIPGEGGFEPTPPETFWQKVWRFIRGLLGLDSAPTEPVPGGPIEVPPGEVPLEEAPPGVEPVPVDAPKG